MGIHSFVLNRRAKTFRVSGVKLEVPVELLTDVTNRALSSGEYEAAEARMLRHVIEPGEVILEIGGGIGLVSTIAARHPNTKDVSAVEGNPALIPVMRRTHELNQVKVTVLHEILGTHNGTHEFRISKNFWSSNAAKGPSPDNITVPMRSFQERLDEIKPTMLIVDIEGGEETLFDNVDLTGVRKVMLEVHQQVIKRRGMKKVFDVLSAKDFHYDQWHSERHVVTFSHVDR